jgi:hypothetical protein
MYRPVAKPSLDIPLPPSRPPELMTAAPQRQAPPPQIGTAAQQVVDAAKGAEGVYKTGKEDIFGPSKPTPAPAGQGGIGSDYKASVSGGAHGDFPDAKTIAEYIRERAPLYGVDAETAVKIADSEGLNNPYGDRGSSFGPFQLHYGGIKEAGAGMQGAGLGDAFTKETGLDAKDGTTWRQQVDYSLRHAADGGWGPWHGRHTAGVGEWEGINQDFDKEYPSMPVYQKPDAVASQQAENGQAAPLYIGDSRAVAMSRSGPQGDSIAKEGILPSQILKNMQGYKGDFGNRDIYLSPGTANLMGVDSSGNKAWNQRAFDSVGSQNIKSQIDYLRSNGADMSRVHVLGVPQGFGGDYANDKIQDMADDAGAQFHVLDSNELHPGPAAYKDVFQRPAPVPAPAAPESLSPAPQDDVNSIPHVIQAQPPSDANVAAAPPPADVSDITGGPENAKRGGYMRSVPPEVARALEILRKYNTRTGGGSNVANNVVKLARSVGAGR